jgi:hypothetical protein
VQALSGERECGGGPLPLAVRQGARGEFGGGPLQHLPRKAAVSGAGKSAIVVVNKECGRGRGAGEITGELEKDADAGVLDTVDDGCRGRHGLPHRAGTAHMLL